MLKQLDLQSFTVFQEARLSFAPGLNVILGENGSGKSHLLKLGYVVCRFLEEFHASGSAREPLERGLASKLVAIFRPDSLGRLTTRIQGRNRCEIAASLGDAFTAPLGFSFATNSTNKVSLDVSDALAAPLTPSKALFLPPKEVLSLYPGFAAAFRDRELAFDETYYDLCLHLERSPLRGPRLEGITKLLNPLEELMGGNIVSDQGRFYFASAKGKGTLEAHLMAEGLRKVGLLAYLLRNGSLMTNGVLFWDEPEANLHPALIRAVAKALSTLAASGIQVVLATQSLFLVRELDLLTTASGERIRYTALQLTEGQGPEVHQAELLEELPPLAALREELEQSERYYALT